MLIGRTSASRNVAWATRCIATPCGLSLAGFQVIIYGRFWVITEVEGPLFPLPHPRSVPLRAHGKTPHRLTTPPFSNLNPPNSVVKTFQIPLLILNDLPAAGSSNCGVEV